MIIDIRTLYEKNIQDRSLFRFYLPLCQKIAKGAVIGSGSVIVKNINEMAVMSGNPATEIRKRKSIHSDLVVESMLGGDFIKYLSVRKNKI